MRQLPDEILAKINNKIQSKENECAPRNSIWISRPQKILTDPNFIELIEEVNGTVPTDFDIAVCHPYYRYEDTSIWQAQITSNELTATKYSKTDLPVSYRHINTASTNPTKCAIAFDGIFLIDEYGYSEFVSEEDPWVFSVHQNGSLRASQINSDRPVDVLRESGCVDVAAVRAYSNGKNGTDFGLVCFYIVNTGSTVTVYYRQFIDNEWKDEIQISQLSDNNWVEITAFRLIDYKIGIHLRNSGNYVCEVLSKSMAISKANTEHISVSVTPKAVLTHINDL